MAPTEGRVARPERRWDCSLGTSRMVQTLDSVLVQAGRPTVHPVCTRYHHRTPVSRRTPGTREPLSRCVQLCTTTIQKHNTHYSLTSKQVISRNLSRDNKAFSFVVLTIPHF